MKTLFVASDREAIHARLAKLQPESTAAWGRMNVQQMVCHIADQLRVALGDTPTQPVPAPKILRSRMFRQVFVYLLPWPKGVPTAPEMKLAKPVTWDGDVQAVRDLADRFARLQPGGDWAVHPGFGPISGKEWGVLCYQHLDHHLRQFGV